MSMAWILSMTQNVFHDQKNSTPRPKLMLMSRLPIVTCFVNSVDFTKKKKKQQSNVDELLCSATSPPSPEDDGNQDPPGTDK